MTPEFSRPERMDAIGEAERVVTIVADAAERAALARRFALPAIERLSAEFVIHRDPAGAMATGRVSATVVQACSVTGEPVRTMIDERVSLRFVEAAATDEEIELSDAAIDTIEIEGGAINLGEVAAETMALALDPFPRAPDAAKTLKAAGVVSEEEAGPLSALAAALRAKLDRP